MHPDQAIADRPADPGAHASARITGRLLALAAACSSLLLGACGGGPDPGPWHDEGSYRWRELRDASGDGAGFRPVPASRTGIEFVNDASRLQLKRNENLLQGSGVAVGDVNGDGTPDVYMARLNGANALYLNRGDWRFEEAAAERGVAAPERLSTGAVLADVDGDGDQDLVLTAVGGPNSLYLNDGSGHFDERGSAMAADSARGSMTAALAPVDGDGDLDLLVANYKARNARDLFPPWERTGSAITRRVDGELEIVPEMREHFRLEQAPGRDFSARIERAEPNSFYLNDGDGRFRRLSWTSGRFVDESGDTLSRPPDYFTLAARFHDVDGDGDQDLYECNDFEDPDLFWLNDGSGRFRLVPRTAVRATSNACMAVDFSDIEGDGDVDFFTIDMLSPDPHRRRTLRPSHTALPKLPGRVQGRPQKQRNALFMNRGDATWAQIAELAGVEASGWSWSTMFLDVDLDGYEDLLVTNGILQDVQSLDANEKIRRRVRARLLSQGKNFDWREMRFLYPSAATPNVAFRNRGDHTFDRRGRAWGWAVGADVSHGMAAGDLDGDGDQDVVVNRMRSEALVMENTAAAPRLKVRLAGLSPNTRGVGASIRVHGGAVPVQNRQVTAGGLYLSSSTPALTFAAGSRDDRAEPADSLRIEVRWADGRRSVVEDARAGRVYEIRQPEARSPGPAVTEARDSLAGGAGSDPVSADGDVASGRSFSADAPLFRDVSHLVGHEHSEVLFEDDRRQPLIPNRLSQLGPGVAWRDLSGDEQPELVIGAGRGGRMARFLDRDGEFRRLQPGTPEARDDQTTVLGIPEPGGGSILIGQAAYEAQAEDAGGLPSVLRVTPGAGAGGGAALDTVAPGIGSSTGPLALADVDGDGDLDLFVGGRVRPGAYPVPASSRIFLNEGDRWARDSANTSRLRRVGLVSSAVFTDVDADGDPDLVLATEWGPVKLFENEGGELGEATAAWGLSEFTSRWNGVTAGDLNGDGRMDLVATSWGRNTPYHPVTEEHPVFAYYGDFNNDGTVNVVEARPGTRDGREGLFPVDHPLQLEEAFPDARERFGSYDAFARATVGEVIEKDPDEVSRREIVTMDHLLFLNRGGRFEAKPLPQAAQLAPAFYAGVADFDGDGHEDVFLSQNFFATADETPRYDAGRGLLLLGNGEGGLEPVPGRVSGIEVYGAQRGAAFADFDGDARTDLVVTQNGAATHLYRNRRAEPGLRVRLEGPPGNPNGVGARLRVVYEDGSRGPAREVHAGSGYWSQDGAVQVMGGAASATAVRVRWPGGEVTTDSVPPDVSEITVEREDG